MTLIQNIRAGRIPGSVKKVAFAESIDAELLAYKISTGNVAIVQNKKRSHINAIGIGEDLRTKVNANIGTSENQDDTQFELDKLRLCEKFKADTVMDLSTGRNLIETRKKILEKSTIPVGTVPIYQCAVESKEKNQDILSMTAEDMFKVVEDQAEEGVDFMTIHCGINKKSIAALHRSERVMDVVSRGGAFTIGWMIKHDKENPFFESFDRLLYIAKKYEITLSLGDGMRPGAIADASDEAQFSELSVLAELVQRSREASVQVIVEGPGHMPLDQITTNVKIQKQLTEGAPFYVLGPLVTDIAPGYDHITGAIGGAIAASAGADFLCYVTPQEHLGLPQLSDVKEGIIASRIAAHAADIVKKVPKTKEVDLKMSKARKGLDWKTQEKISLDPKKIQKQSKKKPANLDACTMCGSLCSMKLISQYLGNENVNQCV